MANYRRVARQKAKKYGLDANVFGRQIQQESGYDPNARSKYARGIAQITPETAAAWGVNPDNPVASLDAAAKHMAQYVKQYGGVENALRAYNAGPGAIEKSKRYAETNNYIKTILGGQTPKAQNGYPAAPSQPTDNRQQIALSLLGMGGYGGGDPLTLALQQATQAPKAAPASYGSAPTSASGKLLGQPIDRAGAHTGKAILSFVGQVAGVYGKPVQLGTGTAHDRLTVNGNVSAHWAGNALDLPATGKQNLALGRAALVAAGMPAAQARKATGGIYNVGNHQIIFQTSEGGNHFTHVHVGLRG